jgi:hypothetical protein
MLDELGRRRRLRGEVVVGDDGALPAVAAVLLSRPVTYAGKTERRRSRYTEITWKRSTENARNVVRPAKIARGAVTMNKKGMMKTRIGLNRDILGGRNG